MIKTVLFDLDGTLLDTEPDFTIILNQLLAKHGRKLVNSLEVRQTVSSGARALVKLGFGINEDDEYFLSYLNSLLDLYDEQIKKTLSRVFENIDSLLQRIDSENLQWGIVTNKSSRFAEPLIQKVDALQNCQLLICSDHLSQSKPDPEGLLLACQKLACQPTEAIFVGDHPKDIEAGKKAGMVTIATAWGYLPQDTVISDWSADKIVYSADEIQHYLFTDQGF